MLSLSFKIWGIANAVVYLVFAFIFLPSGFFVGFVALFFSLLASLPAVAILYTSLYLLKKLQSSPIVSWGLLLVATALAAFVPYVLFHLRWLSDGELDFILALSLLSGYAAVLLLSSKLHYLFQTFYYERETDFN